MRDVDFTPVSFNLSFGLNLGFGMAWLCWVFATGSLIGAFVAACHFGVLALSYRVWRWHVARMSALEARYYGIDARGPST